MKRLATLACFGLSLLAACEKKEAAPASYKVRVGLVLDKGGKDDKSFNAAAFKGATEAKAAEGGIDLKVVEASDDASVEPSFRTLAERGYGLIIGIGFSMAEPISKIAPHFANTKFAVVDAKLDLPNVSSLLFSEHEGSYLMGVAAALKSKTGKIGFIGGMDVPLIRRFQMGFEQGALDTKKDIRLVTNYVGVTGDAWNNPGRAKELARQMYAQGIDVIFLAAGASNMGAFDAAEESKKLTIGCDSNQNWIKPGYILTSMLKRVDVAVKAIMLDYAQGRFAPGLKVFDLSNEGIDYARDEFNKPLLGNEDLARLDAAKKAILGRKVLVKDYYRQSI